MWSFEQYECQWVFGNVAAVQYVGNSSRLSHGIQIELPIKENHVSCVITSAKDYVMVFVSLSVCLSVSNFAHKFPKGFA